MLLYPVFCQEIQPTSQTPLVEEMAASAPESTSALPPCVCAAKLFVSSRAGQRRHPRLKPGRGIASSLDECVPAAGPLP